MSDGYRTKRGELGQPGFRIIRVADVGDGVVALDSPDFVSESYRSQIGAKLGEAGDILLTTKGTVGRVAVLPAVDEPVVYSPQLCYFRVASGGPLEGDYLRFWFRSAEFWHQARDRMNNTDMAAYINLADVRSLQITLPPTGEQRAIAEVLGALDDKIAANTRLATTADEVATATFTRAVADAEWGSSTFADVADIGGGGTPSSKVAEYWDGQVPWASPTDITRLIGPYLFDTGRKITEFGLANCSSRLYPSGSILMTSRATIGAFALAQTPVAVNQGFIVVVPPDDTLRYWLLHEMRDRVDEFLTHANGATFLELSRGNFRRLPVRLAEPSVMAAFSRQANALHMAGAAALWESLALAATRDALLPALMSGTLRVRDAERLAETLA